MKHTIELYSDDGNFFYPSMRINSGSCSTEIQLFGKTLHNRICARPKVKDADHFAEDYVKENISVAFGEFVPTRKQITLSGYESSKDAEQKIGKLFQEHYQFCIKYATDSYGLNFGNDLYLEFEPDDEDLTLIKSWLMDINPKHADLI